MERAGDRECDKRRVSAARSDNRVEARLLKGMRKRRKGATRNAALTVLPTMFNGKIMRVRSKRDSSRKFLRAPPVAPMAIRLAIQWMLPAETYERARGDFHFRDQHV